MTHNNSSIAARGVSESFLHFDPSLIIEVTTVCDRACNGCYAQNILKKSPKKEVFEKYPQFFLSREQMVSGLKSLPVWPHTVSLRGGEPTRHPELSTLLTTLKEERVPTIYLETHGRWILGGQEIELLEIILKTQTIAKISFDSMHEFSKDELKLATDRLQVLGIDFRIAITEQDQRSFLAARAKCSWVEDKKIIFQKKVKSASELIEPKLGIMGCDGKIKDQLNSKKSFRKNHEIH